MIHDFDWYIERSPNLRTLKRNYYIVQMQLLKLKKVANGACGHRKAETVFNKLGAEVDRRTEHVAGIAKRPRRKLTPDDRRIKFTDID